MRAVSLRATAPMRGTGKLYFHLHELADTTIAL